MRQGEPAGAGGEFGGRTISASARASIKTSEESCFGRAVASATPSASRVNVARM